MANKTLSRERRSGARGSRSKTLARQNGSIVLVSKSSADHLAARNSSRRKRLLTTISILVGIPSALVVALCCRTHVLLHAELPDHSIIDVMERRVLHGVSGAYRYYATCAPASDLRVIVDGPRTLDTGPYADGSGISEGWASYQYIGGLHGWDSPGRKPSAVQLEGDRILLLSAEGIAAVLLRKQH